MKIYEVIRIEKDGTEKNYGRMNEEDVRLVTKGYKKEKGFTDLFTRKGTSAFYIVTEIV